MATVVSEPVARQTRTRVPLPPKLRAPGWYRAALAEVLGLAFAFGITALVRWFQHLHPVVDGDAVTTAAMFSVPLAFLVGIGTCDYWLYWAAGRAT